MKAEIKTIDWKKRFREKFTMQWDNHKSWDDFTSAVNPEEMEQFIQQELDLALKERTESLIEETTKFINNNQDCGACNLDIEVKGFLEKLKSKYLKQEEKA